MRSGPVFSKMSLHQHSVPHSHALNFCLLIMPPYARALRHAAIRRLSHAPHLNKVHFRDGYYGTLIGNPICSKANPLVTSRWQYGDRKWQRKRQQSRRRGDASEVFARWMHGCTTDMCPSNFHRRGGGISYFAAQFTLSN